jgi:hypothetical protein
LVTYGVVVVVVAGAVVLLSNTGVFRQTSCEKYKVGFSEVVPRDWAVYQDSGRVALQVENWADNDLEITGVNLAIGGVSCTGYASFVLPAGSKALTVLLCPSGFSGRYLVGECYSSEVTIDYVNKVLDQPYKSSGRLMGAFEAGSVATTTSTTTTTLDDPPQVILVSPSDGANL